MAPTTTNPDPETLAALRWQLEAGVDETIGEAPVDRFATGSVAKEKATEVAEATETKPVAPAAAPTTTPKTTTTTAAASAPPQPAGDGEALARSRAVKAKTLAELEEAIRNFDACGLKRTAMNTVFADGNPDSGLMFVGEAPGAEEDRLGKPFVGPSGHLLDRMMGAAGLKRESDYYISNILPWRPPGNRKPTPLEQAMCLPFIRRHIELVKPRVLVLLGGTAAGTILDTTEGITRLRGKWREVTIGEVTVQVMPTYHPAYLLRQPRLKGEAWRDALEVLARL